MKTIGSQLVTKINNYLIILSHLIKLLHYVFSCHDLIVFRSKIKSLLKSNFEIKKMKMTNLNFKMI